MALSRHERVGELVLLRREDRELRVREVGGVEGATKEEASGGVLGFGRECDGMVWTLDSVVVAW